MTKACEQELRCDGGDTEVSDEDRLGVTVADCVTRGGGSDVPRLIARGTVVYDRAAADACIASFEDLCVGGRGYVCSDVIHGNVAVGGGCEADVECASGSCSVTDAACGECLERIPVGGACTAGGTPCARTSFCQDGVCSRFEEDPYVQVGLGEDCGGFVDRNAVCAPSLYCDDLSKCAARLDDGVRCGLVFDECKPGSVCIEDVDGDERCTPATKTSRPNDDCGDLGDGTYVYCDRSAGLYCDDLDAICRNGVGNGEYDSGCLEDSDCDSRICIAYDDRGYCGHADVADGDECEVGRECRSGICMSGICSSAAACQ